MTPFGKFSRELRLEHGLKLKDQAEKMGISSAYISALEHGRRGLPSGGYLSKMESLFNMTETEADLMLIAFNHSANRIKFWSARPAIYELYYLMTFRSAGLTDQQIEEMKQTLLSVDVIEPIEESEKR